MSKTMMSVLAARNGSRYAVDTSGMSCMSDSWIFAKPRIDEPSNIWPTVKNSSSTVAAGMLKCCCTPGRSVNRMSRNLTSSSLMNFSTSEESLNIEAPEVGHSGSPPAARASLKRTQEGLPGSDAIVSGMLHARGYAGPVTQSAQSYPGERLGRPQEGPGSIARLGRRVGAIFIDYGAAYLISGFFGWDQLAILAIFAASQILFIPVTQGSPGHRIFGLRLVRLDGAWTRL